MPPKVIFARLTYQRGGDRSHQREGDEERGGGIIDIPIGRFLKGKRRLSEKSYGSHEHTGIYLSPLCASFESYEMDVRGAG